jgi:hypothetical protein
MLDIKVNGCFKRYQRLPTVFKGWVLDVFLTMENEVKRCLRIRKQFSQVGSIHCFSGGSLSTC